MILVNGETVFLSFAIFDQREGPRGWVLESVVVDAENRIIRDVESGRVVVLDPFSIQVPHQTAAEAWLRMAGVFAEGADKLMAKADECSRLAGKTEVAV
jgi:hypothetical protein